ncbi:ABC transporter ATP-binding protein [Paenibacillus sp. JNUCC31]|uniref:ABC transporter ATP-binding protein n=1 Tax=Paenibacillus sp. JNUCC-31 TaxID=2777983 RepID=UPI0017866FBE|nr:ABC transporter ATP-binding protein [Paenibacillus sp. JNUCC-31]QOS76942.1 ABC transporter ATP-binding protein [Paenibacillus sp. JNUCC-31]
MILTMDNVSKKYRDKWAVKSFSLELSSGGVYGLLGPNGAGKTTLLRMLVDIAKPTSGQIMLDGQSIAQLGDRYRSILGYMPQRFGFYNRFSAHKFLMYMCSLKGQSVEQASVRVQETLRMVDLEQQAQHKIRTFSGGMRQRLGIAQALLNDPQILVLDEPTAGLDPKERIRFRNIIGELGRDRIVLLSTHIISDLEFSCKEMILMNEGQLITRNTPEEIMNRMQGSVWKAMLTQQQLAELTSHFKVSGLSYQSDGIVARILAKEQPVPQAVPETPRLEDVYMHYFDEEATS